MTELIRRPELNSLSELYAVDAPESVLLAEYPSSNSEATRFQNRTKFIIHDPFPPPPEALLKVLGPHHLMCGWGAEVPVTSQVAPPERLLDHWDRVLSSAGRPKWKAFKETESFLTLFPHESLGAAQQVIDPVVSYQLHSKEVIEKIDCSQAAVLESVQPPCIVKLSHGYAGLGNFLINNEADEVRMRQELLKHWPDSDLVINAVIENIVGDFGVQFYLHRDGSVVWLGFTEQQFDANKKWCGGVYSAELQDQLFSEFSELVIPAANYLHSQGYFGVVGIDLLQDASGQLYLVDVNPRLTGVSPFLMASRIFQREHGLTAGIYQASVRFSGSYDDLIESAESEAAAKVLVVSAFEEETSTGLSTICHIAVNSSSQDQNQDVLERLFG
jgi:hypothetical protein